MDVAEQIVVMNEGAVEQIGPPRDLYEHPGTEFVMSFIGPVNRLGVRFVRPHDVEISHDRRPGADEAMIERIVHLGFEVRIELTHHDGSRFNVQLTQPQLEELELTEGQIVWVKPGRKTKFEGGETKITA